MKGELQSHLCQLLFGGIQEVQSPFRGLALLNQFDADGAVLGAWKDFEQLAGPDEVQVLGNFPLKHFEVAPFVGPIERIGNEKDGLLINPRYAHRINYARVFNAHHLLPEGKLDGRTI